ncbi:MAG: DUF4214 domain-containing protein [Asticcacaulis sp.]
MKESAETLHELLALHDEAFVTCSYRTLLRRSPDSQGLAHYVELVRSGMSKEQIVWQISQSDEARQLNVRLPGLITRRALWRRVLSQVRRYWQEITGQAAIERALRRMENGNGLFQDQVKHSLETMARIPHSTLTVPSDTSNHENEGQLIRTAAGSMWPGDYRDRLLLNHLISENII